MSFERALIHILKVEGGYVDNPADKGGPTKYGITLKTLAAFRGIPVTIGDIQNLTQGEASLIYRREFWDGNFLFLIASARVQNLLFDQVVARGGLAAVMLLQKVLNTTFQAGLRYDGVIGPETAKAANIADEMVLGPLYIREVQKAYLRQAFRDESQMVFLKGWMDRSFTMFDFLN